MLRWRPSFALVAAVVFGFAGCGGGTKDKVGDPDGEALAHVPRDAALVVVASTEFKRGQGAAARDLLERFPGSALVLDRLKAFFEDGGLEFDRDLAPLLGNDVVLTVPNAASVADHEVLVAGVAPDEDKLGDVVAAAVKRGALREGAKYRGADVFTQSGGALAVKGSVVLLARDGRSVRAALDLRARRGGLTPAALRTRLAGLPDDALLRVIGDAGPVLAHRAAAKVRKVPWVAALRRFAAAVTAASDGLHVRFRVESDGALAESQIPLAAGPQPPSPVGDTPVVVGVRDLAHVIEFAQQVAEAIAPGQLQRFSTAKTVIRFARGIDLDDDVFGQFTGTTTLRSDLRRVSVRAQLRDPKAMAKTLDELLPLMPSFLHGAGIRNASVTKRAGGRFVVEREGEQIAAYGLGGDALVVTTDRTEEIRTPGATRPSPRVPRGPGALVARLDPAALQELVIKILGLPGAARLALGALGDATLAVRAERDRIEGRADLAIKR